MVHCPLSADALARIRAVVTARPHVPDAVALAQQQLVDAGFPVGRGGADGTPGADTRAALEAAERAAGITAPGALRIVTRDEWGAQPYRGRTQGLGTVTRITVHHTAVAGAPPTDRTTGIAAARIVQRIHQRDNGWADVGYHLMLAQDGTWYQGRAQHVAGPDPLKGLAWGAHTGVANGGNVGLSVMGYFHAPHNHRMTPAGIASLRAMVTRLLEIYPGAKVAGHRDLMATACPGDTLYPLVRTLPGFAGR